MRTLHHEAIDHGVHVTDLRLVEFKLLSEIDGLPVDNDATASFFTQLREHELEVFTINLERRRPHLDFSALGQCEDRFQDLAVGAARRGLSGPGAVRFADGGEEEIEIAGYV